MKPIRVLVVDDSAVVRQVMTAILSSDPEIEVIGSAADPMFAFQRMQREWPDVLTLDIEMPRMDGITFLKKIMADRPTPVVICSSLTEKGAETTMQALAAGAVHIITKPKIGVKDHLSDTSKSIIETVKAAAQVKMSRLQALAKDVRVSPKLSADAVLKSAHHAMAETTEGVIAIGTSTGGTHALELVLKTLPRVCPGIIIVQHMPEKFTGAFATRLNSICDIEVREANTGDRLMPGRAIIAPGGRHMVLKRSGAHYHVDVLDGPPVNRHKPSVDVLFRSVAKYAGRNALGIIMTGMGDDGVNGLLEMRAAGAYTLAQDEASCVVFGMPREAIRRNAVDRVIPLSEIATAIVEFGINQESGKRGKTNQKAGEDLSRRL